MDIRNKKRELKKYKKRKINKIKRICKKKRNEQNRHGTQKLFYSVIKTFKKINQTKNLKIIKYDKIIKMEWQVRENILIRQQTHNKTLKTI